MTSPSPTTDNWTSAWVDAVAFFTGLAVAWWGQWRASDLVWSLWLSSLVVGYAMILWALVRPVVDFAVGVRRDRAQFAEALAESPPRDLALLVGVALIAGLFMLAFFTVHFGGFHYVHSQLLSIFFPIDADYDGRSHAGRMSMYMEVLRRYWIFLPSAFLAERAAFTRRAPASETRPSVTAEAIAARKRRNLDRPAPLMLEPYRKVMRMHGLIFFFGFAHFAGLENFAVYTVVYAVYFFPWRLTRRTPMEIAAPV